MELWIGLGGLALIALLALGMVAGRWHSRRQAQQRQWDAYTALLAQPPTEPIDVWRERVFEHPDWHEVDDDG